MTDAGGGRRAFRESGSGSDAVPAADAEQAARPERSHTRSERARNRIAELGGRENAFVMYFKERVYATFTGLALVLVVSNAEHPTPSRAFLVLALGVLGITAAGFVADVISHLAVHREFPEAMEWLILLRVAGGALGTAVTPLILIAVAWLDLWSIETALRVATIVYIVTLGVIGWFAVRRSKLAWWQQLVALGVLLVLGLAVIGLQTLAHSIGEH